jgi:hypothetical protein
MSMASRQEGEQFFAWALGLSARRSRHRTVGRLTEAYACHRGKAWYGARSKYIERQCEKWSKTRSNF